MTTEEILRKINKTILESTNYWLLSDGVYYHLWYLTDSEENDKIIGSTFINNQSLEDMIKWVKDNQY